MTSRQAYQEIIDELVHVAGGTIKPNVLQRLSPKSYDKRLAAIKGKLSSEDIDFLEFHEETRWVAAIHDVAARLDWLVSSKNLTLNLDEEIVGESPYTDWRYDFMMRMEGVSWSEFIVDGNE